MLHDASRTAALAALAASLRRAPAVHSPRPSALLEVWRQLWRVCERSDILLVVVDGRNPLIGFPPSLYHYITSTLGKPLVLVLNKIDLLPANVVQDWVGQRAASISRGKLQ